MGEVWPTADKTGLCLQLTVGSGTYKPRRVPTTEITELWERENNAHYGYLYVLYELNINSVYQLIIKLHLSLKFIKLVQCTFISGKFCNVQYGMPNNTEYIFCETTYKKTPLIFTVEQPTLLLMIWIKLLFFCSWLSDLTASKIKATVSTLSQQIHDSGRITCYVLWTSVHLQHFFVNFDA